jgi:ATPase subunit of ABC transporter with duplicated ATPase domains
MINPFSDEVREGERIGLVGPNGAGKSHILRMFFGREAPTSGRAQLGNGVSVGMFTQINDRADFVGRTVRELVEARTGSFEQAMRVLGRYALTREVDQRFEQLSGGQRARLEILALEVEGHNLLLLDEPTDNLDIESADALQSALDGFTGASISTSHDRTFLRQQSRFWYLDATGVVYGISDYSDALRSLVAGSVTGNAKSLAVPG